MTFTRITGHSRYTMQNVVFGRRDAPILVICDSPPSRSWIAGQPMPKDHMDTFGKAAIAAGLKKEDFCFIVPCPSIPPDKWDSERLKAEWLAQHKEEFEELLTTLNYRAVVVSGNLAARQYIGRAVKITKVRGLPLEHKGKPCLPIMSVGYISKVPEKYPMFQADMATLKRLKDARYIIGDMAREQVTNNYKYTFDLSEFIDNPPKIIAVDTETTGLIWHKDDVYPFLAQLTKKQGESYLVPLSERYIPDGLNPKDMVEAKRQLKQILENPNIHKVGHNFKFDLHMLRKVGIEVKGWRHDTMQLAYAADENMISYGLDDCVKVWVPEMAGYDDELARNYDKSRMIEVPFDVMRQYAGGDTDACFRLCRNLIRNLSGSGNYERYTKIVMPSLLMFGKVTEKYGLKVDESKLVELKQSLQEAELQQYEDLISAAPPSAKRNAIKGGYANIGSPKFVREILFSEDGFGLRPRVFTKAGREPSISTKDHLVYFEDNEWVQRYIDYVKLHKLNSTYVTDFDKYITNSTIHPSFLLHRTNTGRVACVRADTPIRCYDGFKHIEDIKIGDRVFTHKHRFRKVLNTYIKPVQEMYEVEFTNGEVLRCTEDHRLLTEAGKWVTLRYVVIKETLKRRELMSENGLPLSAILKKYSSVSEGVGCNGAHSLRDAKEEHTCGRVKEATGIEVFGIEDGGQEPDAGQTSEELQRPMFRWQGLLNGVSQWETLFRSSYSYGGYTGNTSRELTPSSGCSSYRRESSEQPTRQSGFSNEGGASGTTREIHEIQEPIRIARVKPCGSYPVYDIEVDEDHSYETAGCFSHNSENPNGQNFPKRGKLAKDYRKMFIPRDGYVIIEADYAQVELKIAAVMSGDPVMLNAYRTYGDLHTLTAANTMGMTLEQFRELSEDVYEQKRFEAKAINFGFIYGMLAKGFKTYAKTQYKIDYTEQQSEDFRNTFMTRYNQLPVWHRRQIEFAHKHGYVESLHGVKRHLPSIHSKDFATVSLAERQAVNAPVQLLGSDMLLMASERFTRDTDPDLARVVLTVHDAAIVEAREDRAREMASALKWYMENNPLVEWFNLNFPITLDADVKIGPSYGEVSKVVPEIEAICPDYYNRDKDILPPVRFLSSL